jgi:calcium/calmodulin-dependent protein kinase I
VLCLEFIEGTTLSKKIKKHIISEKEALEIIQSILEGLSYMHANNIVHRDIKPSNIMLGEKESPNIGNVFNGKFEKNRTFLKIIDFGLCASMTDRSEFSLMHDKCGTVGYLSPELIGKKSKSQFYNGKVDVFSTGMILFEMYLIYDFIPFRLIGKNPFKTSDCNRTLYLNYKCKLDFEPLKQICSPQTLSFLKKMVAPRPDSRVNVDQALGEETFIEAILDEGSGFLSNKLRLIPPRV